MFRQKSKTGCPVSLTNFPAWSFSDVPCLPVNIMPVMGREEFHERPLSVAKSYDLSHSKENW